MNSNVALNALPLLVIRVGDIGRRHRPSPVGDDASVIITAIVRLFPKHILRIYIFSKSFHKRNITNRVHTLAPFTCAKVFHCTCYSVSLSLSRSLLGKILTTNFQTSICV